MWFPITMTLLIFIISIKKHYNRKLVFKSSTSAFEYAQEYMNIPIGALDGKGNDIDLDACAAGKVDINNLDIDNVTIITYGVIEGKEGEPSIPFYHNVLVAGPYGNNIILPLVYDTDHLIVKCGDFVMLSVTEEAAYVHTVLQLVLDPKSRFKENKLRRK